MQFETGIINPILYIKAVNLLEQESCVCLPKPQVQAFQFPVHILFLIKLQKKQTPDKKDLPS